MTHLIDHLFTTASDGRGAYRTFFTWNVLGGALWGTAIAVAGYTVGNAYRRLEHYLGRGALVLPALIMVGLLARHLLHRRSGTTKADAGRLDP